MKHGKQEFNFEHRAQCLTNYYAKMTYSKAKYIIANTLKTKKSIDEFKEKLNKAKNYQFI